MLRAAPLRIVRSANGTTTNNGHPVQAHVPLPLQSGTSFNIGGALTLQAGIGRNTSGGLSWVRLNRVNNLQNRCYLMLGDAVGIWPERPSILGELGSANTGRSAKAQMQWVDGCLCICNRNGNVTVNNQAIEPGTSHTVNNGDRINIDNVVGFVAHQTN